MSDLQSPGVHLNSAPSGFQPAPADPLAAALAAGATLRTLDLSRVDGRAELMHQLARDLSLPRHFGRNWDALYDVLSDPDAVDSSAVYLSGWTDFQARHSELAASLEGVLLDAQEALADADIPLWVLV